MANPVAVRSSKYGAIVSFDMLSGRHADRGAVLQAVQPTLSRDVAKLTWVRAAHAVSAYGCACLWCNLGSVDMALTARAERVWLGLLAARVARVCICLLEHTTYMCT